MPMSRTVPRVVSTVSPSTQRTTRAAVPAASADPMATSWMPVTRTVTMSAAAQGEVTGCRTTAGAAVTV